MNYVVSRDTMRFLSSLLAADWNSIREPYDYDDNARFFYDPQNQNGCGNEFMWIYHDEDTGLICRYELSGSDFIYLLDYLRNGPSEEGVDAFFLAAEESCAAHTAAEPKSELGERLEKMYQSKENRIGEGHTASTLKSLIFELAYSIHINDIEGVEWTDAFFIDDNAEEVIWIYYNPDSSAGGQFVENRITYRQVINAANNEVTDSGFFEYLENICSQFLIDIDSPEFEGEKIWFSSEPDAVGLYDDTMDKLIKTAKKKLKIK